MEPLDLTFTELFYQDPYRCEFTCTVLSCEPIGEDNDDADGQRWAIQTDQTLFYPEGGGQPSDRGLLGEAVVLDVQRAAEAILHICDRRLPVGQRVEGRIDWARRFDFMQQHSAEHIVSGLIKRQFGYDNVGFHINETEMTFDVNGPLTDEQVLQLETQANEAVWADLPLQITLHDETNEDLPDFRSKTELRGKLRLVTIDEYDCCACCGTHLRRTGEIGSVRIIRSEPHRGGTRLTALCGRRALLDAQQRWQQSRTIGALLSAPSLDLVPAVERQLELVEIERGKLLAVQKKLNLQALATIPENIGNLYVILEESDVNNAKYLGKRICERISGVALVFFPHPRQSGMMYILVSDQVDVRPLHQRLKEQLGAKGGGNRAMAQGITAASVKEIEQLCDVYAYHLEI